MTARELIEHTKNLGPDGCQKGAQEIADRLTKAGHKIAGDEVFNESLRDPVFAYQRGYFLEKELADKPKPIDAPAARNASPQPQTLEATREAMERETDPQKRYELANKARELRGHSNLFPA